MSDTKLTPEDEQRIVSLELQSAAVASAIQRMFGEVPTHIMAAACNIIQASLLVHRAGYISPQEVEEQRIYTDADHLKVITEDILHRADAIREMMKAANYVDPHAPRAN